MEHLALEIFDLPTAEDKKPTTSQFATLPEDTTITFTDTSEIFASGDVWSHSFQLNVQANAHIFCSAGDVHGARLHDQIHKRRARLWVEGLPLYLGYLKLDDEAQVDEEGNVDVGFEGGSKTFDDMIEGTNAREVSVGDVVIGVALNRKRVCTLTKGTPIAYLDGLKPYAIATPELNTVMQSPYVIRGLEGSNTPYVQRWPKLVKSQGEVLDYNFNPENKDYTNVQTPYDAGHPFCNINVCYQMKAVDEGGEEVTGRDYTVRLAHGNPTTDGGDGQARYNNAPNFYLLYFIDRLFKDMGIHIEENQAMDVQDLKRVFLLNYGCHYEEIENSAGYFDSQDHETPLTLRERYGQYYLPIMDETKDDGNTIVERRIIADGRPSGYGKWDYAGKSIARDGNYGKILLRNARITRKGSQEPLLEGVTIEGNIKSNRSDIGTINTLFRFSLDKTQMEDIHNAYSAYLAYATGDNYPDVEISEIIEAMKAMFGIRLLFSEDFSKVRIVLLRNIFRDGEIQDIRCDICDDDVKTENSVRGFRMTYGKGKDDTSYYYKGFNDMFPRASATWKDTTDKHDYSQWDLNADYGNVKKSASAMNKICYVTPVNGNAYIVKVDEDEDVLFPSVFEAAPFMDAEDGDCSCGDSEPETVDEVQVGASPVVMSDVGNGYASLFTGDMKAPTPENYEYAQEIATYGRFTTTSMDSSIDVNHGSDEFTVTGLLDVYLSEGFKIRMMDNYAISNGGTPFDEASPGLQFGIMRGSGGDADVFYGDDLDENEDPLNQFWEILPGSGAIDHADTCDGYGSLWDYNGKGSGVGDKEGRISLKLRAEKPNPYYKPGQSGGDTVISTKAEAAQAMTTMFTTANTNLLTRPKVDNDLIRAAGWNCQGAGYATVYSMGYSVRYGDGTVHEILWTPIMPNRVVLTPSELQTYIETFNGLSPGQIAGNDTKRLILDIDTTEQRAVLLHELQAIYYAEAGESVSPVVIPSSNEQYLEITNPDLRRRGLADQFYKEYSYWTRNARIVKRTVRMTLAQLLAIDKTKRVSVGDVMGFIRKMEFSVSNKTGLGKATLEIIYI